MDRIRARLVSVLQHPAHGSAIRDDLRQGLPALPEWMQTIVRDLLRRTDGTGQLQGKPKAAKPRKNAVSKKVGQPNHRQDDNDDQQNEQHQANDDRSAHFRGLR